MSWQDAKRSHTAGVTGFCGLTLDISSENRDFVIICLTKYSRSNHRGRKSFADNEVAQARVVVMETTNASTETNM
jgi:hypothetical protein